jgi:hypothetical protein
VHILTVNGDDDQKRDYNYLCSENKALLHIYPNPFLNGVSLRFDTQLESDIHYIIFSSYGTVGSRQNN